MFGKFLWNLICSYVGYRPCLLVCYKEKSFRGYQKLLFTVLEKQKDFASLGGILKAYVTTMLATVFGNLDKYSNQIRERQPLAYSMTRSMVA